MQETGLVLATDKYSRLSCKRQQKKQNKSPSVSPHVMKWASKRANAYKKEIIYLDK